MNDRDRLAADLHAPCEDYYRWRATNDPDNLISQHGADAHRENADRLIALGRTRLDRLGACECSICDDRGVPCQNHSDICANCHRDCWGSVYPLDEERLARAIDGYVLPPEANRPMSYVEARRYVAAAIAKAYREDAG